MNADDYLKAHHFSSGHMEALKKDTLCGCFYCLRIYNPTEIEEWIIDDNAIDRKGTALCPYCGIDSVIGENSGFPISHEFLRGMKKYWFNE